MGFFSSKRQHQWVQWFPLDGWWYNTTYHATTKMTPYEVVYEKQPPSLTSYLLGISKVKEVETLLQRRDWTLATLKDNLAMDQNRMKQQVDQHQSKRSFEVGDLVFLRLQPYKKTSLKDHSHHELTPRFYGPYQILQCIATVAYMLSLLASSKIHPIFHVLFLKKVVGPNCQVQSTLFRAN